jgi:hypothetical protein
MGSIFAANEVADRLGIPLADLKASMEAEGENLASRRFTRSVQI